MRKLRALVGLNLKAMLLSFRVGGGKKRTYSGVGALALMGFLSLYLSGTYSFLFAMQLKQVGMLPLLMMLMPVLAVLAGFFFTVFAAQGVIFGGKDNDLMFSLPLSPFTLLLSRLTALYLENLVFSVFVMLPVGAAYLYYGGKAGVLFVPALLIGTAALALLPTLLALLGGFVLSWAAARFTRRGPVPLLLYGVLLAVVLVFSFRASFLINGLAEEAAGIQAGFHGWGLPFVLLKEAACEGNVVSLLVLCALCAGPLLLAVWLLAGRYKAVVTRLQSRATRGDYRLGKGRALGRRRALLSKEAVRFFGTPIYFFNTGLGLLFLLIGGGAALVKGPDLRILMDQMSGLGALPILPLLAVAVCFCLSTVTMTACSINLEGKQLWILKEAPVSVWDLLLTKVGFQLALALPCTLLGVVGLGLGFGLSLGEGALLLGLGAAFALFSAPFGLLVNLYFPKLDAPNDMVAVKQSVSVLLGIFGPMVVVMLGAVGYVLVAMALGAVGALLLCLVALCALAAGAWAALRVKGPALFARLS